MADVKITDNHLSAFGIAYWRGGAPNVDGIGAYGEIKRPVLGVDYLDQQDMLPLKKIKVEKATELQVDYTKQTEDALTGGASVPLLFKAQAGATMQKLREGKLKLVMLNADKDDLLRAINTSPKHLEKLKDLGDDVRVCDTIFVVLEAELAETFSRSSSLDLSAIVKGVQITAAGSHGASGQTSVTISEGSVLAYGLVKLHWDAEQKKNRSKVVKLTTVQWGVLK